MNSELNLELYTIAMTRLNNGFAKVGEIIKDNAETLNSTENDEEKKEVLDKMAVKVKRTLPDFKTSCKEFKDFYKELQDDLNQKEINLNELEPFFTHVEEVFPKYDKDLNDAVKGIKDTVGIGTGQLDYAIADLEEVVDQIIATFTDIYSLASNNLNKIRTGELKWFQI